MLQKIKDHMLNYLNKFNYNEEDNEYEYDYDDDGYMSNILYKKIKQFWQNFDTLTNTGFIYVVSGSYIDDLDLDGGRSYILSSSRIVPLLFEHLITMYPTIEDYENIVHNSLSLTDDIYELYQTAEIKLPNSVRRGSCDTCGEGYDNEKEWKYNTECAVCETPIPKHLIISKTETKSETKNSVVIKYPIKMKGECDANSILKFIGYSLIDKDPIYQINIPAGFTIIKTVEQVLNEN